MAWTRITDKTMKNALVQAAELKRAIDQVSQETGNHNELNRMIHLGKDAEEIINTLSKIARVRKEHLAKEAE